MALRGAAKVIGERGPQAVGDASIENAEADLIVQLEGPVVEIRGADARPDAIDDDDFLMQQSRVVLPDFHAVFEKRAELVMAGVLDDRAVRRAGGRNHDLDVDASAYRIA